MDLDHERLANLETARVARPDELLHIRRRERHGLLAQNVLARLEALQRPRHMQVVGKRVVDHLDLVVGQELLVRAVGSGDAQAGGRLPGAPRIARADGDHLGRLAREHGRDDLDQADVGRAQDAPLHLSCHWLCHRIPPRIIGAGSTGSVNNRLFFFSCLT